MGRKIISCEKKVEAVERYKRGERSQERIAREYGVWLASFQQWIAIYDAEGPAGLEIRHTNSKYSLELKTAAVEAYLRGEGSPTEICKKYCIRSRRQLLDWRMLYNGCKELHATGGQRRGIYMTKGRTTTLDERIEIVSYCIANGKDYGANREVWGILPAVV